MNKSILALMAGLCLAASADTVWLDEPGLWERLSSFHSHPHVTNRWTVASGEKGCDDCPNEKGMKQNEKP